MSVNNISNISGSEKTAINTINNNFASVENDIAERVKKSGDTMSGDLDMNNQDIINVKSLKTSQLFIAGSQVSNSTAQVVAIPISWEGAWALSTNYALNEAVTNDGSSFVCIQAHTATAGEEPGVGADWADYWLLLASKGDTGATGAGTGDMLAANNLSDVASASTSRTNLGLAIGTNVQAQNALLQDISSLSMGHGDIIYFNGTNLVKLQAGTDGQFLQTKGIGANPVWGNELTESAVKKIYPVYIEAQNIPLSSGYDLTVLFEKTIQGNVGEYIIFPTPISNGLKSKESAEFGTMGIQVDANGDFSPSTTGKVQLLIDGVVQDDVWTTLNETITVNPNNTLGEKLAYEIQDSNPHTYQIRWNLTSTANPNQKLYFTMRGFLEVIEIAAPVQTTST